MIELDDLDELFDDLSFDEPTADQIFTMYGIFLKDFKNIPLTVKGKTLKINENRSFHPLFKNKAETFVHVITRKSDHNDKRYFDKHRANKIHWIRPVLENADDDRILCFERLNDKNENQHYFWFAEKEFIVILREIDPDVLLITAFCVDKHEGVKYKRWYDEHKGLKKK